MTPLFFTHDLTLIVGGRAVVLRRRGAAILIALERCRPGLVTDRLLANLARRNGGPDGDGSAGAKLAIHQLRADMLEVGLRDIIQREWQLGFRLTCPIEIIDGARMAEAA